MDPRAKVGRVFTINPKNMTEAPTIQDLMDKLRESPDWRKSKDPSFPKVDPIKITRDTSISEIEKWVERFPKEVILDARLGYKTGLGAGAADVKVKKNQYAGEIMYIQKEMEGVAISASAAMERALSQYPTAMKSKVYGAFYQLIGDIGFMMGALDSLRKLLAESQIPIPPPIDPITPKPPVPPSDPITPKPPVTPTETAQQSAEKWFNKQVAIYKGKVGEATWNQIMISDAKEQINKGQDIKPATESSLYQIAYWTKIYELAQGIHHEVIDDVQRRDDEQRKKEEAELLAKQRMEKIKNFFSNPWVIVGIAGGLIVFGGVGIGIWRRFGSSPTMLVLPP